jgi:glycine/D-amino acid oxidase-like deaminating enzyme
MLPDVDPRIAAVLEATFRRRFPELMDVRVADHWGGPIFLSLDFLPVVGRRGQVVHAIGYAGHGIPLASYAGEMIADLICGRDGPGRALWGRRSLPAPPEPLRWFTFRAVSGALAVVDRRSDGAPVPRETPVGAV